MFAEGEKEGRREEVSIVGGRKKKRTTAASALKGKENEKKLRRAVCPRPEKKASSLEKKSENRTLRKSEIFSCVPHRGGGKKGETPIKPLGKDRQIEKKGRERPPASIN